MQMEVHQLPFFSPPSTNEDCNIEYIVSLVGFCNNLAKKLTSHQIATDARFQAIEGVIIKSLDEKLITTQLSGVWRSLLKRMRDDKRI